MRLWIADRRLFGIIIQKRVTDSRSCGLTGTEIGEKRLQEKRKRDVTLNNPNASSGEVLQGPADNRASTPHKAPGAFA